MKKDTIFDIMECQSFFALASVWNLKLHTTTSTVSLTTMVLTIVAIMIGYTTETSLVFIFQRKDYMRVSYECGLKT